MHRNNILIYLFCLILSCTSFNRDHPVDKSTLTGSDYRLFQNSPAWSLAKAVQDEDEKMIIKIASKEPKLLNFQDSKYGNTLLKLTVMNQQIKPFKVLLKAGADVTIHNNFSGTSAIIESCMFKAYDIKFAQSLIAHGADINDIEVGERKKGNSTRLTPLIAASESGSLDFVEFLVKNNADINYTNEFGQSAFSESIRLTDYVIALFLLNNGADWKQPIFYRPDYTIPSNKRDMNDRGKPMYLVDVLREDFFELSTNRYKLKMRIVDFLKGKGIDYRATPIPDYIREKAQKKYPDTWQEYLEKY
jgi:uncharacterized protein